jgi:hypothetical protein
MRKILTITLWEWSIRLMCWAWRLDSQTVAHLNSELKKTETK